MIIEVLNTSTSPYPAHPDDSWWWPRWPPSVQAPCRCSKLPTLAWTLLRGSTPSRTVDGAWWLPGVHTWKWMLVNVSTATLDSWMVRWSCDKMKYLRNVDIEVEAVLGHRKCGWGEGLMTHGTELPPITNPWPRLGALGAPEARASWNVKTVYKQIVL